MKRFHSKILLFGEHTVVLGGQALAMPYPSFYAEWKQSQEENDDIVQSKTSLQAFSKYLQNTPDLLLEIDHQAFAKDLANGQYLSSNIPQGYGLGSSGALVAAIYDTYGQNKVKAPEALKKGFAQLESYFHGKSSGTDPLICYLNQAFLLSAKHIESVDIPNEGDTNAAMFLLDTHITRQTGPLVDHFLSRCQEESYKNACDQKLKPYNEQLIQAFLLNHPIKDLFKQVSIFQTDYFQRMIPDAYASAWQTGLNTDDYYLKICGAGGGGFLLGYTDDKNNLTQYFKGEDLLIIHSF